MDRENLVSALDLFPTVCDFAGVNIPDDLSGMSLKQNLLEEKEITRDYLVIEGANCRGKAVRSRRYKYITFKDDPVELLFDLEEDPGEKINLAEDEKFAGILEEHRKYLREWHSDIDAAPCIPIEYTW